MLVTACALPLDAPNWDVVWNLPLPDGGQTISVTSFLPAGTSVIGTAPNQAFRANVSATPSIVRSLGVQCPTCPSATAPKPAFTAPLSTTTITLTSGTSLNTATLTAGSQVVLQLVNGFTFDPIRPPGVTPNGTVTLTVANGATTLGTLTLLGATSAIPAGQTSTFTIPLAGVINTAFPITVSMTMDSPAGAAGSPVTMNPSQLFTVNATPTLNVSQATVTIAAQAIAPTSATMDLSDGPLGELEARIDSSSTANEGTMFMEITNPLTIGASGTLTITISKFDSLGAAIPIPAITKPFTIAAGTASSTKSVTPINFTGNELAHMLGGNVTFALTGNTGAGTTTVTPTTAITILTRLQVRAFIRELE